MPIVRRLHNCLPRKLKLEPELLTKTRVMTSFIKSILYKSILKKKF